MNEVSHTLNLTIQSLTISKTAVLGVFFGLFGLRWGTRCPQMCDSGSPWVGEKKNYRGVGLGMNRGRLDMILTTQNRKVQLCWEYFGLFPRSVEGSRGPRRVIKAPLGWGRWI